jgi:hypothetical protein
MPTVKTVGVAYLCRRLLRLSRRLPAMPTAAVGVAYADGISRLCRRPEAVGVEISCCSDCRCSLSLFTLCNFRLIPIV